MSWLLGAAGIHLGMVGSLWLRPAGPALGGWLAVDALGLVVLSLVSVLFFVLAAYAVGYLRVENPRGGRLFVSCLLAFLAAASLVVLSHQMGLMWVGAGGHDAGGGAAHLPPARPALARGGVEVSGDLVGGDRAGAAGNRSSSPTAQVGGGTAGRLLVLEDLVAQAPALSPAWLKAAFVFLLVGFGTKMGLAPMHTWKPDTYGEAPPLVGGLMAGALTSCAFLGIARIVQVTPRRG